MRINQVVIMPDKAAQACAGRFSEPEMIASYTQSLADCLDEDRVPYRFYDECDPIVQNSLVVHCLGGFGKESRGRPTVSNFTTITFGSTESEELATLFCEGASEWGKCFANFHHKTQQPKRDLASPLLNVESTIAIAISPFKLNGPDAESYMKHLPKLGEMLGHIIYEYLLSRSEHPRMMGSAVRA